MEEKKYIRNFTEEARAKQKEHLSQIRQKAMEKKREMKEITLILLQILFIIIVFSSSFLQLNKKITINRLGFFEKTSMNIILILNIILFLSFINIDLKILYSSFFF